jgi:hypothetical protein
MPRSEDERHARGLAIAFALAALGLVGQRVHPAPSFAQATKFAMAPKAPPNALLSATLEPGKIVLEGAVRSESDRATLMAAARGTFLASDVEAHLRIVPSASDSSAFRAVLGEARAVRWGTLFMGEKGLELRGDVREAEDLRELERALHAATSEPIAISLVRRRAPPIDANVLEAAVRVLFAGPLELGWKRSDLDEKAVAVLEPIVASLGNLDGLELTIEVVPNEKEPATDWTSLATARAESLRKHLATRQISMSHVRTVTAHRPPAAPLPKGAPEPTKVAVDLRFYVRETRDDGAR